MNKRKKKEKALCKLFWFQKCIFLLTYNNLLTCNNYQLPLLITIRTYTQKWVDVSPVQLLGEVSQTFAFFEIFLPCLHFYYTTKLLFVSILLTTYPHLSSNVICESSLTSKLGHWPNWQCCLASSSKTAPRILIVSIAMGAEYLSYVKFIATEAPTFLGYIISVLAMV